MGFKNNWVFTVEELVKSPTVCRTGKPRQDEVNAYVRLSGFIVHVTTAMKLPAPVTLMAHILFYRFHQRNYLDGNRFRYAILAIHVAARHLEYRLNLEGLFQVSLQALRKGQPVNNKTREYYEHREMFSKLEKPFMERLCFDFDIEDYNDVLQQLKMNEADLYPVRKFFENISLTQITLLYDLKSLIWLSTGLFYVGANVDKETFPKGMIKVTKKFVQRVMQLKNHLTELGKSDIVLKSDKLKQTIHFNLKDITDDSISESFQSFMLSPEEEKQIEEEEATAFQQSPDDTEEDGDVTMENGNSNHNSYPISDYSQFDHKSHDNINNSNDSTNGDHEVEHKENNQNSGFNKRNLTNKEITDIKNHHPPKSPSKPSQHQPLPIPIAGSSPSPIPKLTAPKFQSATHTPGFKFSTHTVKSSKNLEKEAATLDMSDPSLKGKTETNKILAIVERKVMKPELKKRYFALKSTIRKHKNSVVDVKALDQARFRTLLEKWQKDYETRTQKNTEEEKPQVQVTRRNSSSEMEDNEKEAENKNEAREKLLAAIEECSDIEF